MGPVASVVTVGDELLLGQGVDTNSAWLSQRLTAIGLAVRYHRTVGDSEEDIQAALEASLPVSDVIVFSGGLGPTSDDRTREAVASALDLSVEEDQDWLHLLEARFRQRGFLSLPTTNLRQCLVPAGAELLDNPIGTAPGLAIEWEDTLIILLPGVPRELKAIFEEEVENRLRERLAGSLEEVFEHRIHLTGIPESVLAERVSGALAAAQGLATVGYYPNLRGVELVLRVAGGSQEAAGCEFKRLEEILGPVLEPHRIDSTQGELVEAIAATCVAGGKTLSVAESCTGGLIAKRLTDVDGASLYFSGGVIAYDNRVKQEQLGVSAEVLGAEGAVSEPVALAMAEGVVRLFETNAGIGITGVAGPSGGSEAKPVGTVWYAVHVDGRTTAEVQIFSGDRAMIRERAAQAALTLLFRTLRGPPMME